MPEVVGQIGQTLDPNPPVNFRDGGVIQNGVDSELDALRTIARDSKSILLAIETAFEVKLQLLGKVTEAR